MGRTVFPFVRNHRRRRLFFIIGWTRIIISVDTAFSRDDTRGMSLRSFVEQRYELSTRGYLIQADTARRFSQKRLPDQCGSTRNSVFESRVSSYRQPTTFLFMHMCVSTASFCRKILCVRCWTDLSICFKILFDIRYVYGWNWCIPIPSFPRWCTDFIKFSGYVIIFPRIYVLHGPCSLENGISKECSVE